MEKLHWEEHPNLTTDTLEIKINRMFKEKIAIQNLKSLQGSTTVVRKKSGRSKSPLKRRRSTKIDIKKLSIRNPSKFDAQDLVVMPSEKYSRLGSAH